MRLLRLFATTTTAFTALAHAQTPATRPPVPGAPAGTIAFVDVAVIPMDTERVLPSQTVLIQNGWVTALGPSREIPVPTGAVRIDGQGKYLIPGMADMHVHLGGIVRISSRIDSLTAEDQQYLLDFVAYGVTTVRNMAMLKSYNPDRVLWLRNLIATGKAIGPRIYTSGQWRIQLDDTVQWSDFSKYDQLANIESQVAAYKAAGYDFIKVYGWDKDVFDSLMASARRVGIPAAGHIPPGITLEHAMAAGMKSFEHLLSYVDSYIAKAVTQWGPGGTIVHYTPEIGPGRLTGEARLRALAAATKRAGVWNSPTLVGLGGGPEALAFIKALQEAGAGLLSSTDGIDGPGSGLHAELKAFVRAGLTPYQALVTTTREPAAYFGTLDSIGTVAVGKRADLVLLNGNPLQDVAYTTQIAGVMLGGRWLDRPELDRRLAHP